MRYTIHTTFVYLMYKNQCITEKKIHFLYLRFRAQAADLDRLHSSGSGDRNGVRWLGGAGQARGRSGDGRGNNDARQRGGAGLAAGLTINNADLVDGGR